MYQPYIAKEFIDPKNNQVVSKKTPVEKRKVISKETSEKVRYALENVVAKGSGKGAYIDGYRRWKTGTAQKVKDGKYLENNYIVSFIGFAPADDPEIVVYVAVDNPKGVTVWWRVATPIVGNILRDALPVMGVKPRKEQVEKEYKWGDTPTVEVPNLIGMKKKDLQTQLVDLKLDISGDGEKVIKQSPEAGAKVKEGSKIRIYFGN